MNFHKKKKKTAGSPKAAARQENGKNVRQHRIGRVLLTILCGFIIIGCVAGCILTVWVFSTLDTDEQMLNLDMQKLKYTTIFYADDGVTELSRAYDPKAGNRIWCDYEDIPRQLVDALVAVEDKRYWEHNGVDFFTTTKAGFNAVLRKIGLRGLYGGATPGGSTLTQQVVRNITGDNAVDGSEGYARKLREIFRALNLEKYYTKEQILETYLNLVGFSQNCSGIRAAANVFFNKDVSELTLAESATIIGTTKNPTAYDPFTHWEANQERKDYILGLMHEQGKLTDEEWEDAKAEEIELYYGTNGNGAIQSWFIDYVTEEVCQDLAEKFGISEGEAYQQMIGGGYRIYTTCDERVQGILEDVYSTTDNFPPVNNEVYPESAFVITDTTGAIKGIVGSNRPKEVNRAWSRASDTTRQPGSTIKPISSYGLSIENDLVTYSTVIEDRHVVINPDPETYSQPLWAPKNEDSKYRGFITVQYALMRSINTIPVQLTQKLGTDTMYHFLHDTLNMTTLTPNDNSFSPMALGSLTNGVTLVEMAGAYQMYSNGGLRTEPYGYTRVEDIYGNVVLEANTVPVRVISAETATVMNKLLQTVAGSGGTGAASALSNQDIPVAGKTGTTDDSVDQWYVGLTPYYVGVCWLGYDNRYQTDDDGNIIYKNGKPAPNSIYYAGVGYPPPKLWKKVMDRVHEGCSGKTFDVSSNVSEQLYCTDTGMLAGPGCMNTAAGWYKNSNMPQVCSYHNYGESYGVPIVGLTAPECGITYPDQYLTDAYDLQKAAEKKGLELSVKEAIAMAQSGMAAMAMEPESDLFP